MRLALVSLLLMFCCAYSTQPQAAPAGGASKIGATVKAKIGGRANPDEAIRQFNIELRATRAKPDGAKRQRATLRLSN